MHTILYQPGAGGDMVTSLIDPTDFVLATNRINPINSRILTPEQIAVTGNWHPGSVHEVTAIYESFALKYKAISSHLFWYYIEKNLILY